jgi:hypothetical protein
MVDGDDIHRSANRIRVKFGWDVGGHSHTLRWLAGRKSQLVSHSRHCRTRQTLSNSVDDLVLATVVNQALLSSTKAKLLNAASKLRDRRFMMDR